MTPYEQWINRQGYILYDPINDLKRKQYAILKSSDFRFMRCGGREYASPVSLNGPMWNTEDGMLSSRCNPEPHQLTQYTRFSINDVFDSMPNAFKEAINNQYTTDWGEQPTASANWTLDHLRKGYCTMMIHLCIDDIKEINCILSYCFPESGRKMIGVNYEANAIKAHTHVSGDWELITTYNSYSAPFLHFYNQLPETAKQFFA